MKITVAVPSLVVLIGVSGSGKSTFARQHFAPTEIVSSDYCRALICDDENNQAVNADAFELLHLLIAKRLTHRKLTVVDATNVEAMARKPLLDLAAAHEVPAVAIVFNVPEKNCLERDAARTHRTVGKTIIHQQSHNLRLSLGGLRREGFAKVHNLFAPEEVIAITRE